MDFDQATAEADCTHLLTLGALTLAAQRCDDYLARSPSVPLQILRTKIHSATTDHTKAERAVRELRRTTLTDLQQAQLARIAALAAADRNDYPTAESELDTAERHLHRAHAPITTTATPTASTTPAAPDPTTLPQIGRDRLLLDVRRITRTPKLPPHPPTSPPAYLHEAATQRHNLHFDDALALITRCTTSYAIPAPLHHAVLHELTVLLVMTRQPGAARRLFPLLVAEAGPNALANLPDATRTITLDPRLNQVRKLVAAGDLIEAEWLLGGGNSPLWHLTAGELAYARHLLPQAAQHLRQAVESTYPELKALALRKLGDAYADTGHEDAAAECWTRSHHLTEATDQLSADLRGRRLHATPDAHDGRVLAALRRVHRDGPKALAALVVAMDPAGRLTDQRAAKRWLRGTLRHLPRDHVVWMMHATPDQLHHVIIGRHLTHLAVDVHISAVVEALSRLKAHSPKGVHSHALAGLIALPEVLDALPQGITRIAVVAGDVLGAIPLATLPVGGSALLGHTHALSHLPSLSALEVLRRRSHQEPPRQTTQEER